MGSPIFILPFLAFIILVQMYFWSSYKQDLKRTCLIGWIRTRKDADIVGGGGGGGVLLVLFTQPTV